MPSFTLTKKANADMLAIGRYTIEKWGKAQCAKYLKQLDSTFFELAESPDIGRKCDDIRSGYYKYGVGKHLVFYRKVSRGIEIVRILHGSMDIEQHV